MIIYGFGSNIPQHTKVKTITWERLLTKKCVVAAPYLLEGHCWCFTPEKVAVVHFFTGSVCAPARVPGICKGLDSSRRVEDRGSVVWRFVLSYLRLKFLLARGSRKAHHEVIVFLRIHGNRDGKGVLHRLSTELAVGESGACLGC